MKLFFSPDYVVAGHAFDTNRKAGWVADSLAERPIDGVEVVEPRPVTAEELEAVHDSDYVRAVRTGRPRRLAESQGFEWDPGLWRAVCASTGGVRDAVGAALADGVAGSLSSGLHHARRDSGTGYCTFNGLALAARQASAAGTRVLVVDLDAHCGGGTHGLVAADPRIDQVDVSTSGFDGYRPVAPRTLDLVVDARDYLPTIRRRLDDAAGRGAGLVLYNAGMDAHEHGGGGIDGITAEVIAERERLVFDWARGRGLPVAFVLAGGYLSPRLDREALVDLHRLTVTAAVGV